jgi:hypothetical protein
MVGKAGPQSLLLLFRITGLIHNVILIELEVSAITGKREEDN